MGSSSGATLGELITLAGTVLSQCGLRRPDMIATLASKAGDSIWTELAAHYDCALRFFEARRLEEETPRLANPSEAVFKRIGCHGVAEAAALAGAGPTAKLVVHKTGVPRATAALAVAGQENR
ncbi:cobalamin biosynthesis protein [Ochrobactrum sp. Q0168]|uniref:cobalamin biosynthesis protein n=1 Tax=Ochrobactrum sp. Q0168 TaxID=2793241 RepID=UPI0018EDFAE5|nr:cobalamin biosynthesis protein [Ochrobactrum sp. Q0168]